MLAVQMVLSACAEYGFPNERKPAGSGNSGPIAACLDFPRSGSKHIAITYSEMYPNMFN